jgi:Xaa-Pro aminopeptidase
VRRLSRKRGVSAVLLDTRATFAWLTLGGQAHVVLASERVAVPLLVTDSRCVALAPANEAPRIADEEVQGLPIAVETLPWHEPDSTGAAARAIAGSDVLPEDALGAGLIDARMRLSPPEHERMRWLGGLADGALSAATSKVTPGTTEDDAVAALQTALAPRGVRTPVLLAAADDRIARYRHPLPVGRPVERRLMLVLVAERWGLHVAATRFAELEPPTVEEARRADACATILGRMRAASRPGATLADVLEAARAGYAEHGAADEWELHHQGGTIGYAGRERIATPGDTTVLAAGMAVAWNPSITGAKAESTDLVGEDGPETILG